MSDLIEKIIRQKKLCDGLKSGPLNTSDFAEIDKLEKELQALDIIQILLDEVARLKSELSKVDSLVAQANAANFYQAPNESAALLQAAYENRLGRELHDLKRQNAELRSTRLHLFDEGVRLQAKLTIATDALKKIITKHKSWLDRGHWCDSKKELNACYDISMNALAQLDERGVSHE